MSENYNEMFVKCRYLDQHMLQFVLYNCIMNAKEMKACIYSIKMKGDFDYMSNVKVPLYSGICRLVTRTVNDKSQNCYFTLF